MLVGPRVVIQGWYGNGNLGDEIILECMIAQIKGAVPDARFIVVSDNPDDTKKRHGVESIPRRSGKMNRLRRLVKLVRTDLFILGGGGLLKQYGLTDLSVLTWLGPLDLAHEIGVPTMTYGVGVSDGFSPRAEEALKSVLSRTDAVLVRDQASSELLTRLGVPGVRVTADPSFLLPELYPDLRRKEAVPASPVVSVFVNQWFVTQSVIPDRTQWRGFEQALARCLDHLVETSSASVRFVPMQVSEEEDDDRKVANEVRQLMTHGSEVQTIEKDVSSSEALGLVSQSDLVIGMRLHSLVLAAIMGVPAVAIDYHSKVRNFADATGTLGWLVEISDSDLASIEKIVSSALSGEYPAAKVAARVNVLRESARENARVAAMLLQERKRASGLLFKTARGVIVLVRRTLRRKSW